MPNYTLPESVLYPMESLEEMTTMAETMHSEFLPVSEIEIEIFDRMLVAAWLRRRYEKVRSKLYDRKHTLELNSPQLPVVVDSIRRFQHEVEQQKRQLAALRKLLRRSRQGEVLGEVLTMPGEEVLNEYLPAA